MHGASQIVNMIAALGSFLLPFPADSDFYTVAFDQLRRFRNAEI